MLTTFKSAVLSAAIAVGAITGAPAVAQAESGIYFHLGTDDGYDDDLGVQVQDGYTFRRYNRRMDRRYEERRYREEYRRCSPERAAWKARRMGLERVRVVDVGRRTITVIGRDYGDRVRVTFGRSPSCPVVGRY
jgi:hypothetical protein